MNSKYFVILFVVLCVLSTDMFIPTALAGHHHRGNQGIELLLAAGILAKLLHKKGGHHHHHHGHHHHGHHHGSGSAQVEVQHAAPSMGAYSYPAPPAPAQPYAPVPAQPYAPVPAQSYASAPAATSYSSSVEFPNMYPAASHAFPMPQMPYSGPSSAAAYLGFEPQPIAYAGPGMMPQV